MNYRNSSERLLLLHLKRTKNKSGASRPRRCTFTEKTRLQRQMSLFHFFTLIALQIWCMLLSLPLLSPCTVYSQLLRITSTSTSHTQTCTHMHGKADSSLGWAREGTLMQHIIWNSLLLTHINKHKHIDTEGHTHTRTQVRVIWFNLNAAFDTTGQRQSDKRICMKYKVTENGYHR